ncbi:hypothetical protein HG535_0B04570 [Zygotorulaspora mrakii]|uniref:Uncharacterized protein n=1 Tax=Zygotorulaspora mrakii TaxID=42260 RepID=A0A7H9AYD2_ZYGMR|nr:uncharacterized protein HG535_0B04570 [Zygotorulaspora mrakii]QLG71415.1 hypothetical protein HG535_0B04570 [Zygotorulaspora mrakii]
MFNRSAVTSSIIRYRPSRVFAPQAAFISCHSSIHTCTIAQKSAKEVVKENLEKLNKKIGKVAAEGIEKTQEASHRVSEAASHAGDKADNALGHAEEKANQKSADVNENVETAKDKVKDTVQDLKKKVDDST